MDFVTEFIIIIVVLYESSHMGLLEIYWGHVWLSQVILRLGTVSIKFPEHFLHFHVLTEAWLFPKNTRSEALSPIFSLKPVGMEVR